MKTVQMTNKQAYDSLNKAHVHWARKDKNHIIVWTAGYLTQDCHEIEKFLMQAGMQIVRQDYDKICGKTFSIYKHKTRK